MVKNHILVIHLEALGAVLRATSILPAIKRKYPDSHVTWVTQAPAEKLLQHNPFVDRVLTTRPEDLLIIAALEFDLALVVDKSLKACGVLAQTRAREVRGFICDKNTGAILPASAEAEELWQIGLDDHQKFFVNQKPETQLITEALGLVWQRDEYQVALNEAEEIEVRRRERIWRRGRQPLIGLNTGCSGVIPYKKWTVDYHRQLILRMLERGFRSIVLLGGPEDTERNQEIANGMPVINSDTEFGLRDGLVSVAACDIVVSGDSLGMHMAIALKKFVVAWFGPTCAQEIDLFDRGVALRAEVSCSPCWKRNCQKPTMCYDSVSTQRVLQGIESGAQWKISSSKPPFSETSSSPSL